MSSSKQYKTEVRNEETGLTPLQERAAIMLASGSSVVSVAEELNISKGTLYQWRRLVTFTCYQNEQKKDYLDTIRGGVMSLADEAIAAIRDSLHSDNEATRLKAAMWVADKAKEYQVGETDAKIAIRKECTAEMFGGWEEQFDEATYRQKLKELGLKEK